MMNRLEVNFAAIFELRNLIDDVVDFRRWKTFFAA